MEKWGLVLAGGGAKGAYQIGVWKALLEYGYMDRIKAISGDSIGAVNACLFAGSNYHDGKEAWQKLRWEMVFAPDLSLIDLKEGSFSRWELIQLLDRNVDYECIRAGERQVFVNVTKLLDETDALKAQALNPYRKENMEAVYYNLTGKSDDEIRNLVLASSALPIVYESVVVDEQVLRDGGLTDNLPAKPLYDAGYRNLIYILLDKNTNVEEYTDVNSIIIRPSEELGDLISGTLNFSKDKIAYLMELGYKDASYTFEIERTEDEEQKLRLKAARDLNGKQVAMEFTKKSLEEQIQGEFDKVQSYLDKYDIKF